MDCTVQSPSTLPVATHQQGGPEAPLCKQLLWLAGHTVPQPGTPQIIRGSYDTSMSAYVEEF